MLWGGLRPIRRRFFLDVLTLLTLTYGIIIPAASNAHHAHAHAHAHAHDRHLHKSLLILPCLVTLITARFTHRWTISLPMIPIVLLQCTRYWLSHIGWAAFVIKILSLILIAKSFLLTILFPAVKISPAKGKYNVGIIDLHIPVENFQHEHVTVRLLYPCLEKSERLPYFNVDTADAVCKLLIKIGAPPPLNKISFILDTWKLSTINAKRNATPLEHLSDQAEAEDVNTSNGVNAGNTSGAIASGESSTFPIVVYSHGLTGSAELYSYQTMSLAASGTVVMTIVHTDGSAIGVKRKDGSFMQYDDSIGKLSRNEETFVEHIRARRGQADYRAKEFLSAAQALLKLNETNIEELEHVGISFVNKLNTADVTAVGHSFGAATALGAANRRPDLFKCMVAHDPAIDWAPDDCRRALLPKHRFQGSELDYKGGTAGYEFEAEAETDAQTNASPSIHDLDLLFLYSDEWKRQGWGTSRFIQDLFKRGQLGLPNGPTDVGFIYNAHHSEFGDSCMLLPLWLARATKVTGLRNPHETSEEIFDRTLRFIQEVRKKRVLKEKKH